MGEGLVKERVKGGGEASRILRRGGSGVRGEALEELRRVETERPREALCTVASGFELGRFPLDARDVEPEEDGARERGEARR